MALEPGTKLGRYQIRSKLGAGGMGEVYLAHDDALDRSVALKILPGDLAAKKDRMERFVREAKAAAALNHPNIAHIYEIGESDGLNFIAMEFVDGDTLRQLIHGKPADLKKLLRYLQHTAEAMAKAHATGIVHRDLKPDNIMVTREGHAKILDFGLAKLIEPQLADPSKASAEEQITAIMQQHSIPGVVMGTLGYMSPEQARGDVRDIDHRSDIFSFGCILFEAATKQKPFMGDSMVKSLHKIIYEPAPLLVEFNPTAPSDLQRIVRRCLAKDPDERYQTIKDVAIELKELRREIESGGVSAQAVITSPSGAASPLVTQPLSQPDSSSLEVQTAMVPGAPLTDNASLSPTALSAASMADRSTRIRTALFAATAVIGLVGLSVAAFMWWRSNRTVPFAKVKATRITANGKATNAAISPDGRYIVHVINDAGRQSLELRLVATNTNQEIVPAAEVSYSGLAFSQDGNYLYYVMRDRANPRSALFRKPVLGGEAGKVVSNIGGHPSFSPDGKRLAFVRFNPDRSESAVIVAIADGSGEQTIASRQRPDIYREVAWSPDGNVLALATVSYKGTYHAGVATIPVNGGQEKPLTSQSWFGVDQLAWAGDGSGLIVSAVEQSFGQRQLFYVAYPSGAVHGITNDLNDYSVVSVTADSKSLVTVQREANFNVWVTPVNASALSAPPREGPAIERSPARQITSGGTKLDGSFGLAWLPDGRLTYSSMASGSYDIWIMQPDGSGQKQLTSAIQDSIYHTHNHQSASPDGRYIVFTSDRVTGVPHIWRMNADGSNLKQLTSGSGELMPKVTSDGRSVIYGELNGRIVSRVSIDGGEASQITDQGQGGGPAISADGKLIAFRHQPDANGAPKIGIIAVDGGSVLKVLEAPATAELTVLAWTPDSLAVIFLDSRGGMSNLWSQSINGGEPTQLTDFRADRISWFDFSRDGKWLALSRGNASNDVVLFSNVK
jgi:serine/threonine protein kinase/Tol biopolymer transport system component